ncbi:MAG: bifunctional lysine ketoglutarate reductase /saccharopine dehydrogenase family protein [Candidatus Thermoplasmatota archaeon]|nr:bifunctional lysine ketoglutarate reductase /saccharopine dehydrogenase family protein [Candidatus Thermoplasmatota archaeon]
MSFILGIRKEDKNEWERRVPLVPRHVKELKEKHNIETIVQTSSIRAYTKEEYESIGAKVQNDLSSCPVVFAVKEIPKELFEENKTYVFFSHVIKGQKYNMPMLKEMTNLKCNLIDYEKIADDKGRRLVFFGRYAGLAGMIDSLWTFGQRMEWKEINTPFRKIKQALKYESLEEAKEEIKKVGEEIKKDGLPDLIVPLVVGFAGYGNVSKGAQEILDCLPVKEISPKELEAIYEKPLNNVVYKVVFKEKDMVEPIFAEKEFELQDYYNNPGVYRSIFQRYVPRLSILMNCIYWDKRYPRLITKEFLEENFTGQIHLQVVGDISIDVNGAIEFTEKATNPGDPVFIYNPIRDNTIDGFEGSGVAVLAVDTLPCELPRESSEAFGDSLMPFVEAIVKADYTVPFEKLDLPPEIKKAMILYHGKLTPGYEYMNKFL